MPDYNDDIERYLRNELTQAERHRLEKMALSDPFLAEALEGAESIEAVAFSHDVNQLQQQIQQRKKNHLFWPLRIAAGIIIIISAVVLTSRLSDDGIDNQLALQKPTTAKEVQPLKSDQANPQIEAINPPGSEQPSSNSKNEKTLSRQPEISAAQVSANEPATTDEVVSPSSPAESELNEAEADKEIMNEKDSQPSQGKSEEAEKKSDAMTAPTLAGRAAERSVPSSTRSIDLKKKSEIASNTGVYRDNAQPMPQATELLPMPIGGFLEFNQYVENNLRYPQSALMNHIQGNVIIQFQINANGDTENHVVIQGLGFGCDEEAIRLLKEGPKWTPVHQKSSSTDSRPRVTIPFRLEKKSD